ncbi:hypothetical protein [Chamaesiphon sp. VAR_48_metabat_403]|uniref:hypothetical protein n=1 Tax=Chamaesiphon sp. VAR_48_metabat_403 TaxID=2964700 RepID=UPI00286DEB44|nr:hypothetical protein [Chamaesiphon sp. VAR_48_metabat_403]
MKIIVGLSSIALVSFVSITPGFALDRSISSTVESSVGKSTLVAGGLTTLERELKRAENRAAAEARKAANKVRQTENREAAEARQEERKARQTQYREEYRQGYEARQAAAAERRAQSEARQAEAAKKQAAMAAEAQKREAEKAAAIEKERAYYASLSPARKKEYDAQKQAQQQARWQLLGNLLNVGMSMMGDSSPAAPAETGLTQAEIDRNNRRDNPAPQTAPAPAPVINDFFGTTRGVGQ